MAKSKRLNDLLLVLLTNADARDTGSIVSLPESCTQDTGLGDSLARWEKMMLQDNAFVEQRLPQSILRTLTDEEMAVYRQPFITLARAGGPKSWNQGAFCSCMTFFIEANSQTLEVDLKTSM